MQGLLWLHYRFGHLQVALQVSIAQHGLIDLRCCLLFQLKHQIVNIKSPISLCFVENDQQFMNISKMTELALDYKSKERD